MKTMYEHIQSMTKEEMQEFVYWVYMNGYVDGKNNMCDDYGTGSYFGGAMLSMSKDKVMPELLEFFPKQMV